MLLLDVDWSYGVAEVWMRELTARYPSGLPPLVRASPTLCARSSFDRCGGAGFPPSRPRFSPFCCVVRIVSFCSNLTCDIALTRSPSLELDRGYQGASMAFVSVWRVVAGRNTRCSAVLKVTQDSVMSSVRLFTARNRVGWASRDPAARLAADANPLHALICGSNKLFNGALTSVIHL